MERTTVSIANSVLMAVVGSRHHAHVSSRPRTRGQSPTRLLTVETIVTNARWLAIGLLLCTIGTATPASAATPNSCIQSDGHVYTNCTLDANFKGTITVGNSLTLDCAGRFILGTAVPVNGRLPDAVRIDSVSNVTVKNCNIINGETGIRIDNGRNITLLNNRVTANYGDGIDVNNSDNVTIQGGIVSHNGDEGIDIDTSTAVKVRSVTVLSNGYTLETDGKNKGEPKGHGIAANSSSVEISSSAILFNAKWGLDVEDLAVSGGRVSVQFNDFYNNVRGTARVNDKLFTNWGPGNNKFWLPSTPRMP